MDRLDIFDGMRSMEYKHKVEYTKKFVRNLLEKHERPCVACSFGKDSTVTLHIALQYKPDIIVVFSNTGVEMPETLRFRDFLVKEWNLNYYELKPEKTFWQCVKEYGYPSTRYLSKEKKKLIREGKTQNRGTPKCCYWLKERPAMKFYKEKKIDLVLKGLTWDESYTRKWHIVRRGNYYYSKKWGCFIALPIAYWSQKEVWRYIHENNLPVNEAYKKVERVGCITCTSYLGWEEQMKRAYPKLYEKIKADIEKQ